MYGCGISALVIAILIAAQNRVILIILLQIKLNTIIYFKAIWLILYKFVAPYLQFASPVALQSLKITPHRMAQQKSESSESPRCTTV